MKAKNLRESIKRLYRSRSAKGYDTKPHVRPIVLSKIVARQRRAPLAVAAAIDFTVEYAGILPAGRDRWPAPAYCLSYARERVFFAMCPDNDRLFEAPFLWEAQYQLASHVATVPFERLHEFVCALPPNPIFVFSIGRCGSTLFSALLRASGIWTVSEPDLLTQLAMTSPEEKKRMGSDLRRLLVQSCVASLAKPRKTPIAIKLRNQCNGIASEIAQIFPNGTYVVIMREPRAWLCSRLRALGGDPKLLAGLYRQGLETFHELQSLGVRSLMIWYEDLIADPVGTLGQLGDALSGRIGITDVRSVMNADSQAGTVLEKDTLVRPEPTAEQIGIFDDEWEKIKPHSWIERYALRLGPS